MAGLPLLYDEPAYQAASRSKFSPLWLLVIFTAPFKSDFTYVKWFGEREEKET